MKTQDYHRENPKEDQQERAIKPSTLTPLTRKSQLYPIITNRDGSPDHLAINIYYDTLRSWYVPNKLRVSDGTIIEVSKLKTKGIFIDYNDLSKTYHCSKETIRRKLVKLEQLELIKRSFKHRQTVTTKSYNQMIIYVWKDTPHFTSKYGVSKDDIAELQPQTNHQYISTKYNIDYLDKNQANQPIEYRGGIHTCVDTKELIEPFNKLKDRSSKSNFNFNSFFSFSLKHKKLIDHFPISPDNCKKIRTNSGRDHTDNCINQLLLKLSKEKPNHKFYTHKGFMNYMSISVKHELRDEVATAGENYRMRINYTDEDILRQKQERYLSTVETNAIKNRSNDTQLKARIASRFPRDKAYDILTHLTKIEIKANNPHAHFLKYKHMPYKYIPKNLDKPTINLTMTKDLQLSSNDKHILAGITQNIEDLDSQNDLDNVIVNIIVKEPMAKKTKSEASNPYTVKGSESEYLANITCNTQVQQLSPWKHIRKIFIDNYYSKEKGIFEDLQWFVDSAVTTTLNQNNSITIKARSNFVKDTINSNFLYRLRDAAKQIGYNIDDVISDQQFVA